MNPETIFAIIAYAIGMVYICRGVSMKQEKQDYLNGYELSKLHGFIKANVRKIIDYHGGMVCGHQD